MVEVYAFREAEGIPYFAMEFVDGVSLYDYVHDRDGKERRALTSGDWMVDAVVGVDEDGGKVYFTANRADAGVYEVHRVSLDGQGATRIFYLNLWANNESFEATFKNLRFTRGLSVEPDREYGGCIYHREGQLTLWNVTFEQCEAEGDGGFRGREVDG